MSLKTFLCVFADLKGSSRVKVEYNERSDLVGLTSASGYVCVFWAFSAYFF